MIRNITYLVLIIAAALTIGSMTRNAGSMDAGTFLFMVWAISPYLLVGMLVLLLGRLGSMRFVAPVALVVSVLMLAFTAYVYWIGMDHTSSTEALAYVFVPVYLHVGGIIAIAVAAIASKLAPKAA